jgi:ribosomal protein L37E
MGPFSRLRPGGMASARHPLPPAGVIRRERNTLRRLREEKLRDLGGLMLEMYRRDIFREDLLGERCNELLGLDARLRELEELYAATRHGAALARCDCGAPLPWGSHFCPNCGRPAGEQPVMACADCGHPLPADARFCASCGAPATEEARAPDEAGEADEDAA